MQKETKNGKNMNNKKSRVELGFKDLEPQERVLTIALMVLSGVVFVLAILQLVAIWEASIKIYVPLMAVMMLIQAKLSKKTNPRMMKTYLILAAVLVVISALLIFFG